MVRQLAPILIQAICGGKELTRLRPMKILGRENAIHHFHAKDTSIDQAKYEP